VSASLRRQRLQRALVVVQVAASVVLLAGAGLLTRTLLTLADVDTGLRGEHVLTIQVPLLTPTDILTNPAADVTAKQRYEEIRREIAALPGVLEAGVGSPGPLRSSDVRFDVKAEGRQLGDDEPVPAAQLRTAGAQFFRAAGIPLLSGREFRATDTRTAAPVVIINQHLADRLFPGLDPVGRRIAWTGDVLRFAPISGDWRTVVGVAGNTRDGGLDAEPGYAVYMPFDQIFALGGSIVIRTDGDPTALIPAATDIIRRIAPTAPIERVATIQQIREESISPRRLNATLLSAFGVLALLIAAVGIAGVLAFSVSARTSEIGIRMSLGADSARVQRMVLGEGGSLIAAGLTLGVVTAAFATRTIRGLLFGVEPTDAATLLAVTMIMATIGIAACWAPARRAARVDPATAIRAEG
jgi:predicted permease